MFSELIEAWSFSFSYLPLKSNFHVNQPAIAVAFFFFIPDKQPTTPVLFFSENQPATLVAFFFFINLPATLVAFFFFFF